MTNIQPGIGIGYTIRHRPRLRVHDSLSRTRIVGFRLTREGQKSSARLGYSERVALAILKTQFQLSTLFVLHIRLEFHTRNARSTSPWERRNTFNDNNAWEKLQLSFHIDDKRVALNCRYGRFQRRLNWDILFRVIFF